MYVWSIIFRTRYEILCLCSTVDHDVCLIYYFQNEVWDILCLCSTVDHDVCLIYYFQNEVWDIVSMFYSWPWCMSDLLFSEWGMRYIVSMFYSWPWCMSDLLFSEWGMRYCVYVLQLTMMYVWSIIFRMRYEILCLCSTVDHDVCLIYYFQNEVWDIVSMFIHWSFDGHQKRIWSYSVISLFIS